MKKKKINKEMELLTNSIERGSCLFSLFSDKRDENFTSTARGRWTCQYGNEPQRERRTSSVGDGILSISTAVPRRCQLSVLGLLGWLITSYIKQIALFWQTFITHDCLFVFKIEGQTVAETVSRFKASGYKRQSAYHYLNIHTNALIRSDSLC